MKISVVIAVSAYEIDKLRECLLSVKSFANEIIIFSLGMEDRRVGEKLKGVSAKVVRTEKPKYIEVLRNKMAESAAGPWILMLDPDERLTKTLKEKLKEISREDKFSVVNIPRKNIFFGHWIAHTSWWPDKQLRFFKKGSLVWSQTIHKYPEVYGKVLDLPAIKENALEHYGFDNLIEFIDRHNRYSSVEAENLNKDGVKYGFLAMTWQILREFVRRYTKHQGYLDGFWGFALSYLMAFYKLTVWVKLWQIQQKYENRHGL